MVVSWIPFPWSNLESGLGICIFRLWILSTNYELRWVSILVLLREILQIRGCSGFPILPDLLVEQFDPILSMEEPFDLSFPTIESLSKFFSISSRLIWGSMSMPSSRLELLPELTWLELICLPLRATYCTNCWFWLPVWQAASSSPPFCSS